MKEPDNPDSINQIGWFQVLKSYLPNQRSITQAKFFRAQGLDAGYYTGARWTSQLITFF
jgi:hypothetical protein